jgi:BASS family bile acid:Na+ symporter
MLVSRLLNAYGFTLAIVCSVGIALEFPNSITHLGAFETKKLIIPLLQIIMFGMGTGMSFGDFKGVFQMPKAVLVGILAQFTIMPLVGYVLAHTFQFEPEIAAGVVLIGCAPSGVASNVMTYLAGGNLPLSITLTACTTLLAPLLTPLLMQNLAGAWIEISFFKMLNDILQIVLFPIAAGLLFNTFFHGKLPWLDRLMPKVSMFGIGAIITIITAIGHQDMLQVGIWLVLAAILHNAAGYFLGFYACKLFRFPTDVCRTVAIEVGLQNAGLASGLAVAMGKAGTLGLAAAVFGPWMNVSGSALANYWRKRP